MFLFQLATDAGEFKESDHPRKDNGQFGQGGGGSYKPYAASNHLHGALKANGFKKHKDPIPTYSHPSGTKVIIQPHPEGAAHSSGWESHKPGFPVKKGSGIKEISQLLRFAVEKAEKKAAEAPKPSPAAVAPTVTQGTPASTQPGFTLISTLPTAQGKYGSVSDVFNVVNGKGYIHAGETEHELGTALFKDPSNGSLIQYNPDTGDWIAQSKGHQTKEGNGVDNLQALLSGKPPVFQGSKAPWQNTNKKIGPKPEAPQPKPYELLRKKIAAARPMPTDKEADALATYKGSGYTSINNGLRHNQGYAESSSNVKAIDSFLTRSTIPEDVTLYRGVKGDYAKILKSVIMEGTKFVDRGFVSTSTNTGTAQGFASGLTFAIKVPKGSMGAAVRGEHDGDGENEILIPRNSAFIVKSYDPHSGHVEVELDQSHLKKATP